MSTQQWQRTLSFMTLFLGIAWSAIGFAPTSSQAIEQIDYFPPPAKAEIKAILKQIRQKRLQPQHDSHFNTNQRTIRF